MLATRMYKMGPIGQMGAYWNKKITEADWQEIRLEAYYKWERAGRPQGRDLEFWLAAEKEFFTGEGNES